MAAVHVQFMKEMMEEDIGKVEQLAGKSISPRPLIRRMSSISSISKLMTGAGSEGAVSRIIREKIVNPATGKPISVARVFVVTPENLPYQDVGWIHRSCIDKCMICNASFGMMNRKHNCTACGNVVCNSCSNREAEVEQLQSLRLKPEENKMKYRVCKRCIKGAKRVSASVTPRNGSAPLSAAASAAAGKAFFPESDDDDKDDDQDDESSKTKRYSSTSPVVATSPTANTANLSNGKVSTLTDIAHSSATEPIVPQIASPTKNRPNLLIPTDSEVHFVEHERAITADNSTVSHAPVAASQYMPNSAPSSKSTSVTSSPGITYAIDPDINREHSNSSSPLSLPSSIVAEHSSPRVDEHDVARDGCAATTYEESHSLPIDSPTSHDLPNHSLLPSNKTHVKLHGELIPASNEHDSVEETQKVITELPDDRMPPVSGINNLLCYTDPCVIS